MAAQMKRFAQLAIAKSLEEALLDSKGVLDQLIDVYRIANENFSGRENDVDPVTIAMGLQAQALGIMTLCNWLEAISTVTNARFWQIAQETETWCHKQMDNIGIVIPDNLIM